MRNWVNWLALDTPESGELIYNGKSIKDIRSESYHRNKIGMIFQAYNLIPFMSAVENVRTAISITDNELPNDIDAVAYNLLDHIGITRDKAECIPCASLAVGRCIPPQRTLTV